MLKLTATLDPNQQYTDYSKDELIEWCGLIPYLVHEALTSLEIFTNEGFIKALDAVYGCGLYRFNGTVTADNVYQSSGDPDLHPLCVYCVLHNIEFIVYPYGITAFKLKNDEVFVYRLD